MTRPVPSWRELALVAAGAALIYAWFFHGRGLDVPDEGLLLHVAERLASGEVPYRDVYFIYTPGFQYLLALAFKLLGPSLEVERALLFAVHVGLVVVVYALTARLTWRPLAVVAALAASLVGAAPYRTLAALVAVSALVAYAETGRRAWLVATGALIGTGYLVGQEIGVYTLAATLGYLGLDWLAADRRWTRVPRLLGRTAVVVLVASAVLTPWLAIMAAQGALAPMLDDTVRVTFLHQPRYMHVPLPPPLPLIPDDLAAQVVWGPPAYLAYVKLMIYLPILLVAAAAGVLGARQLCGPLPPADRRALPIALLAGAMLGTLAFRADYYHLRQILPVTLVLLAWLLGTLRLRLAGDAAAPGSGTARAEGPLGQGRIARLTGPGDQRRILRAAAVVAPLALIAGGSLGEAWHARDWLSVPLTTARGTVLVDATTARDLGALLADLRARTRPDEPIFVAPAETAVYFLADRPNPTRFGQLVSTELEILREDDGRRQRELVSALEAADVRWLVAAPMDNVNGYPFAAYAPLIAAYLEEHFTPVGHYGYWTLLAR